jgi:hypothetical protein
MPRLSTTADRAALARRRSRTRAAAEPRDPCPLCGSDLGGVRATTRRRVVFSPVPGTFRWQCPDCAGIWVQGDGQQPATAVASAATSPAGSAGL